MPSITELASLTILAALSAVGAVALWGEARVWLRANAYAWLYGARKRWPQIVLARGYLLLRRHRAVTLRRPRRTATVHYLPQAADRQSQNEVR